MARAKKDPVIAAFTDYWNLTTDQQSEVDRMVRVARIVQGGTTPKRTAPPRSPKVDRGKGQAPIDREGSVADVQDGRQA